MNQMPKLLRKAQYAKIKGVSRQYISELTQESLPEKSKKLKVQRILDVVYVVDCEENDKLFKNKE